MKKFQTIFFSVFKPLCINCCSISSNGDYIVTVTDCNLVCIWKQLSSWSLLGAWRWRLHFVGSSSIVSELIFWTFNRDYCKQKMCELDEWFKNIKWTVWKNEIDGFKKVRWIVSKNLIGWLKSMKWIVSKIWIGWFKKMKFIIDGLIFINIWQESS